MPTTKPEVPINPDVPEPLKTPPGSEVGVGETKWYAFGGGRPEDVGDDRFRYAMFSGGDDSLSMVHKVMSADQADAVLYLSTNSGLAENLDYVKDVCRRFDWPLRVEGSPMSLPEMAMKYGFPGVEFHGVAYTYFKERQLSSIASETDGKPEFITGVRKHESERRMKNVSGDGVRVGSNNGRWIWVRPIHNWHDEDVGDYRDKHDLPRNPIAAQIHRSGDCYCGAYAKRDELLIDLEANGYHRHAVWLQAVETKVQEYRGRVALFEARYPDEFDRVDDFRDGYSPKPMILSAARHVCPEAAAEIDAIPKGKAIEKGRTDKSNYWAHDNMDSSELRSLLSKNDPSQMELCRFCDQDEL